VTERWTSEGSGGSVFPVVAWWDWIVRESGWNFGGIGLKKKLFVELHWQKFCRKTIFHSTYSKLHLGTEPIALVPDFLFI
jgi:hypothetical protein